MPSRYMPKDNFLLNVKNLYMSKGIVHFIHRCFWYLIDRSFTATYYNKFKSSEEFVFQGKKYHYIFHRYCTTWKNERCAIIPITLDIIKDYLNQGKNVLEIGNVISHICPVSHDIVDKYEIADGVINEDVTEFHSLKRYDLIFSIVTLQQVGSNESRRNPTKIIKAIENLKKILSHDGILLILHGLGENKEMDKLLETGKIKLDRMLYLKKICKYKWREAEWEEVRNLEYDYSVPTARAVLIGVFARSKAKKLF